MTNDDVIGACRQAGACLEGHATLASGLRGRALADHEVPAYPPADAVPPELAAIPPVKPGSRSL